MTEVNQTDDFGLQSELSSTSSSPTFFHCVTHECIIADVENFILQPVFVLFCFGGGEKRCWCNYFQMDCINWSAPVDIIINAFCSKMIYPTEVQIGFRTIKQI